MKVLCKNIVVVFLLFFGLQIAVNAQCANWNDSPKKEEAENAHTLYRDVVKNKTVADLVSMGQENFEHGFNNWKTAYDIAPAADGNRAMHYSDGRKFYKALAQKEADEAKKKEYQEAVFRLYDEEIQCYKNEAYLLGRKGFDMFYSPLHGFRTSTLETFQKAVELGGNKTEYIVYDPLSKLVVYLFQNDKMSQEDARNLYLKLEEIAKYNEENNKTYGPYYKQGMAIAKSEFKKIEDEIFDCAYFKGELLPEFEKGKDDLEIVKYVYNKLVAQGCDPEDAELQEIKSTYETMATEINAKLEEERRANNPCYDGTQLQKEEKYSEALARYQECVESGDQEGEALAQIYYSMAFIQTWKLRQYGSARSNIVKAREMKTGWGKPLILLGDIYAKMSTGCKEDWDKRLAILAAIEKYSYAKSIDADVASDANKRIGQYSSAKPNKEEGFMRKVSAGDKVKVGCGIGETVTISFN